MTPPASTRPATQPRSDEVTRLLDGTYRKADDFDLSHFATSFELCNAALLENNHYDLIESKQAKKYVIRTERYKHNVHARLSLCFLLKIRDERLPLDTKTTWIPSPSIRAQFLHSSPASASVAYVAFYSEVEHGVSPVNSGQRITLTCNLFYMDVLQDKHGDGIVWVTGRQWDSNVVETDYIA
ncbi:hypothetical protein EDD18DRAFT_1335027 [Armillaria luteobubalina]|uniref:Prolyl 4-hydroxylase alpha subunit Fe(2+) 2OG dioxygenase domain-containing protein n=1 Tax=Armillaria luteobubalina TaxID=153913 RepID=A0AA39PS76_9AGAR|nr:hypothetical protein EDD18DRAFT_1335027 [Armillaria luteobubalina]